MGTDPWNARLVKVTNSPTVIEKSSLGNEDQVNLIPFIIIMQESGSKGQLSQPERMLLKDPPTFIILNSEIPLLPIFGENIQYLLFNTTLGVIASEIRQGVGL